MPAPVVMQSQLQALETGMKNIRSSQLIQQPEVNMMYNAIEKHHRDFRLAHLTGKPRDLQEQGRQDTKFFYILVRMIMEVLNSRNDRQKLHMKQIYKWYEGNKHVLHAGPRFGRKKSGRNKPPTFENLEVSFERMLRDINTAQDDLNPEQFEAKVGKENEPGSDSNGSLKKVDNGGSSSDGKRPHTVSVMSRKQEMNEAKRVRSDSIEHLLPRRKPVPLSHLYNPHAKDLSATLEDNTETTVTQVTSPIKLRMGSAGSNQNGGGDADRMAHRKKWDAFQQEQNYGQDALSRLQYLGRSGVAGGQRYTAHDHGLSAEHYTQNVISGFIDYEATQHMDRATSAHIEPRPASRITEPKLEDFYELAEKFYPPHLPKYPSFNRSPRAKSAPAKSRPKSSKASSRPGSSKSTVSCTRSLGETTSASTEGEKTECESRSDTLVVPPTDVKLDTVVSMIDSVTDEMSYYKEKLAPEPQPGFRQPVVTVDPSQRPHTAPAGATARPASPAEYYNDCTPRGHDSTQSVHNFALAPPKVSQYPVHFRREMTSTKSPVIEAIDWRGRVTPDSTRYRPGTGSSSEAQYSSLTDIYGWSSTAHGGQTHVKMLPRPRSSYRTAGSTHAGHRPKTAPVTPRERWNIQQPEDPLATQAASHMTREVDEEAMQHLMQVQHLGGTSKRRRRRYIPMGYEYLWDKYEDSRPSTEGTDSQPPNLQFVPITAPKLAESVSRSTSPSKSRDDAFESHSPVPSVGEQLTYSLIGEDLPGCRDDDDDSGPSDLDLQDVADLDDDLEDAPEFLDDQAERDNGQMDNEMRFSPFDESSAFHEETSVSRDKVDSSRTALQNAQETCNSSQKLLEEIKNLLGKESTQANNEPELEPLNEDDLQGHSVVVEASRSLQSARTDLSKIPSDGRQSRNRSAVKFRQPLTQSEYWSYVPKHEIGDKELDLRIQNVEKDLQAKPSTPRQGKTKIGRAFPKREQSPSHTKPQDQSPPELTIEGVATGPDNIMRARSAGSVPLRAKNTDRHLSLLKQQEMLRKAPAKPYRTPPSIPSPYNPYGARSPRRGEPYSAEHEMHAVKDNSPRRYITKVGDLRKEGEPIPAINGSYAGDLRPLTSSLQVNKMRTKGRWMSSPQDFLHPGHPGTPVDSIDGYLDETGGLCGHRTTPDSTAGSVIGGATLAYKPHADDKQKYLTRGRPIPDYLEHVEPEDYAEAMERQRQAKAAVDIQRLFRGYVVRNNYSYLLKGEREKKENQRSAAVQIQRHIRGHLARKRAIGRRPPDPETLAWVKTYRDTLIEKAKEREAKALSISRQNLVKKAEADAKLEIIGPHVEVYMPFHPKATGPSRSLQNMAAVIIQKQVRGWVCRTKMDRLRRKAKQHGGSWTKFVKFFKELQLRIQRRLGVNKPQFYFSDKIADDFLDTKKRYENTFDQKSFGNELDPDDLTQFFKECDLYPSQSDIENAFDLIFRGHRSKQSHGLHRQEVLEVAFQIYPPKGTGITTNRKSTWMTPIIEGEEALKLKGSECVEPTDFKTCWDLVSTSVKARNKTKASQQAQQREEKWQEKHGQKHDGASNQNNSDNRDVSEKMAVTEDHHDDDQANSDHVGDSEDVKKDNDSPEEVHKNSETAELKNNSNQTVES